MTTQTLTLTDFLLARIAEDEEIGGVYEDPARRRAECDAKRRIVEMHVHYARWDDATVGDQSRSTLELLTLPYVDHPDYREWKS